MNKKLIAPIVVGAIGLAGLGAMTASAASNPTSYPPIVQKIAQKFGLKEADVEAVFDQNKADHQAAHQTLIKSKLDQAVKDGKITAAQEQAILSKLPDLQKQQEADKTNFKNMTPAHRQAAMQKERQDLTDWAKQNNIDLKTIPYVFGGPRIGGFRGHMLGKGPQPGPAPESN